MNYKMGGGGSGATNLDDAVRLYDGLDQAGNAYNSDLYQLYQDNADLIDSCSSNIWAQMAAVSGIFTGQHYLTDTITKDHKCTSKK